jgi:hypothetical protein
MEVQRTRNTLGRLRIPRLDTTGRQAVYAVREVRRTNASAKKAGSSFERSTADYLALVVDDRIDRRVKNGAKDRGDIGGVRIHGQRVVLECKNTAKTNLGPWATEAEIERGNDDALAGVVIHKRHGKGAPEDQWVTMTLADFAALVTGSRDHINEGDE